MVSSDSDYIKEHLRKQAWDYFQLHASQRLTTFNFYLVVATLITTGLLASFQKQYELQFAGIVLGFLLIAFSFVFWKLDQRNKQLIKHAERALRSFESQYKDISVPSDSRLFTLENDQPLTRIRDTYKFWEWDLTYSSCFKSIFLIFVIFGLLGIVISAALTMRTTSQKGIPVEATVSAQCF